MNPRGDTSRLPGRPSARAPRPGTRAYALRRARHCYRHLAGRLGVAVTEAFVHNGLLDDRGESGWFLTDAGLEAFSTLGAAAPRERTVRSCLDGTERRGHLAGEAGRLLLARLRELEWVVAGSVPRSLIITEAGRVGLLEHWGVVAPE